MSIASHASRPGEKLSTQKELKSTHLSFSSDLGHEPVTYNTYNLSRAWSGNLCTQTFWSESCDTDITAMIFKSKTGLWNPKQQQQNTWVQNKNSQQSILKNTSISSQYTKDEVQRLCLYLEHWSHLDSMSEYHNWWQFLM